MWPYLHRQPRRPDRGLLVHAAAFLAALLGLEAAALARILGSVGPWWLIGGWTLGLAAHAVASEVAAETEPADAAEPPSAPGGDHDPRPPTSAIAEVVDIEPHLARRDAAAA